MLHLHASLFRDVTFCCIRFTKGLLLLTGVAALLDIYSD